MTRLQTEDRGEVSLGSPGHLTYSPERLCQVGKEETTVDGGSGTGREPPLPTVPAVGGRGPKPRNGGSTSSWRGDKKQCALEPERGMEPQLTR